MLGLKIFGMSRLRLKFLLFSLLFIFPAPSVFSLEPALSPPRKVIKVFDGDTIVVSPYEKVRIIGIDTMEVHDGEKLSRQARIYKLKEKEIKKQGDRGKKIAEKLLGGKFVRLAPGREAHDDYGRTLAYVYFTMPEDKFAKVMGEKYSGPRPAPERQYMFDRVMVQYGWAQALTHYPFDYLNEFVELETSAKKNRLGIWKSLLREKSAKK